MQEQPAIAIGATHTFFGTKIRRVVRIGDRDGFEVENLRWSNGVVVVFTIHECKVERLPPISGSGGAGGLAAGRGPNSD